MRKHMTYLAWLKWLRQRPLRPPRFTMPPVLLKTFVPAALPTYGRTFSLGFWQLAVGTRTMR